MKHGKVTKARDICRSTTPQRSMAVQVTFQSDDVLGLKRRERCTLKDLCDEDKQKVAKLIRQVVELGQEVQQLTSDHAKEASKSDEKIHQLRQRNHEIIRENTSLRSKLTNAFALLRTYQHKVRVMDAAMHASQTTAGHAAAHDAPSPLQLELPAPQPAEPAAATTQLSSGQRQTSAQAQDDVGQLADAMAALGRANGSAKTGDPPPVEVLVRSPTKQAAYKVQVRMANNSAAAHTALAAGQASADGTTPPLADGHAQQAPSGQDGMDRGPFAELAANLLAWHMDETKSANGSAREDAKQSRTRVLRFDPSVGKSGQFHLVEADALQHSTAASSDRQSSPEGSARSDLQSNRAAELDHAGSQGHGSDTSSQQDARLHDQQGSDGHMHDQRSWQQPPGATAVGLALPHGYRPLEAAQPSHLADLRSQPGPAANAAHTTPSASWGQEPSQATTLTPEASWTDRAPTASSNEAQSIVQEASGSTAAPRPADRATDSQVGDRPAGAIAPGLVCEASVASVATCDSRAAAHSGPPAPSASQANVSSSVQHPQPSAPPRNGAYPGAMYSGPTVTTGSQPWWHQQPTQLAGSNGVPGQQQWAGGNAYAVPPAPLPQPKPAPAVHSSRAAASRQQSAGAAAPAGRHLLSAQQQPSGPDSDSARRPSQSVVAEMLGRHLGADYFDDALMDLVAEVDSMVSGDEASSVASEASSARLAPGSTAGPASLRYAMPLQPAAAQHGQNWPRGYMPSNTHHGQYGQQPQPKAIAARQPVHPQPQEKARLQHRPVAASAAAYQAASPATSLQGPGGWHADDMYEENDVISMISEQEFESYQH